MVWTPRCSFEKHRFWTKSALTEKPSTYWYRQGHATFIRDLSGMALRHRAGVANIMWSTDYPHSDSTWPRSREALAEHCQDVPADERAMIAGGNAARLYRLG
jgi:predicted TIM-barrel fold metal-dependent hydrolase